MDEQNSLRELLGALNSGNEAAADKYAQELEFQLCLDASSWAGASNFMACYQDEVKPALGEELRSLAELKKQCENDSCDKCPETGTGPVPQTHPGCD